MPREADRRVASVAAALEILETFAENSELRLIEIERRTRMTRSRILRCLGTLEAAGFLTVDADRGSYSLGPKILALASAAEGTRTATIAVVRPVLKSVSEPLRATCFFSVIRSRERVILAKHELTTGIQYAVREGDFRPLHVGATGKVLLAFCPADVREEILASPLKRLTDSTVTDPARLRKEIAAAEKRGFSLSFGEATGDAFALAVPVISPRRDLRGALTVAGPIGDMNDELQARCLALLRAAATHLSGRL